MTSKGSGAFQAASVAQSMMMEQEPGVHVEVVDTLNVSLCQGWMAIEAARSSLAGLNLNQVLARLGGRLFPFGLFKFLWYRRHVDGLRTLAMGVLKPYRNMGVDVCLYHETITRGLAKGYRHLEMSWILADNVSMNVVLQKFGAEIAKTYQLYDYRL